MYSVLICGSARPAAAPTRLTAAALAEAIREAVSDEAMQRRAAALAARIQAEDGLAAAVAVVKRIVGV